MEVKENMDRIIEMKDKTWEEDNYEKEIKDFIEEEKDKQIFLEKRKIHNKYL